MKPEMIEVIRAAVNLQHSPLLELLPQCTPPKPLCFRLEDYLHAERDQLLSLVRQVEAINETMQQNTTRYSAAWHRHETLDDRLHDILTLLGD